MSAPAGQTPRGPSPWERVDLSTSMIDLHLRALVVAGADDAMIAEVGGRYRHAVDPEEIRVRCWVVNAKRPSSPTVRAFTTVSALAASQGKPEAEVLRLAAMVRVTFETARAHAETVGLAHLPTEAQDPARRAAGAARLARSAPSEPERQAAQAQVTRILSSLALYYLPTPRAGELTP